MGWLHELPEEIQTAFFESLVKSSFNKGDYIYRQKEEALHCYFLFKGSVQLRASSADGKQALISVINGGELLGEVACIDGGRRAYNAITTEKGTVGTISAVKFNELRRQYPIFNDAVTSQLVRHIRDTVFLLNQAALWSLEKRVLRLLLQNMDETTGVIKLSQEEMGHALGVTRQSIHRVMKKLSESPFLDMENRRINVSNAVGLRQLFKEST